MRPDASPGVAGPLARLLTLLLPILLVGLLSGCGAAWHAESARKLSAQGHHDQAISRFEQAVSATRGDPVRAAAYRDELQAARVKAAHQYLAQGEKALANRQLAATGEAFRKARTYAPSDPLVVASLSKLLKLRLEIETGLDQGFTTLGTLLARRDDATNVPRWNDLLRTTDGLQVWKAEYPRVVQLRQKLTEPAALAFLADARRLAALEMFDEAAVQVARSLELLPGQDDALALQDKLRKRGHADRLAREGDEILASGKLLEAIARYKEALAADERCHAGRTGLREARRQYVARQLEQADKHLAANDEAAALLAVREARAVGTDAQKEAAALKKISGRLFRKAAEEAYARGRAHEKRRRAGAALVAYRTAQALESAQPDLARRIAAALSVVSAGERYGMALSKVSIPSGSYAPAGSALAEGLLQRLQAASLGSVGMSLLTEPKAEAKADGTLTLSVERFELRRVDRPDTRRKKYLDRVEFTPNSKWEQAQKAQSATLARLNAATDVLRPLQQSVDRLETRLEQLQGKQVALHAKIAEENRQRYADPARKNPCPATAPDCPQSWAAKRWEKHTAYYVAQVDKANAEMQALTPSFNKAREEVATAQAAFDESEMRARETPSKLRQEIWLDHVYEVTAHQLAAEATVTLAWKDKASGKELHRTLASYRDLHVDFSTPAVVVRKQTLEPAREGRLPTDEALASKMVGSLLDDLTAATVPQLRQHGQRFVTRIGAAKNADDRVEALVRALGTGAALPEGVRKALAAQLLEATGYDWLTAEVDVARLPATKAPAR